ncbi:MAG: hypothetical protein IJO14_02290 [Clostridia bacterium]|nr:hypothetical protein [Clostridia bacterium]
MKERPEDVQSREKTYAPQCESQVPSLRPKSTSTLVVGVFLHYEEMIKTV